MTFLTRDIPGCGGQFKATPEDFEVEELPAYAPSGEGEHLFLWVEKRGLSTPDMVKRLARAWNVRDDVFSWAGLKDAQAVTRQWVSLLSKDAKGQGVGDHEGFRVLAAIRHQNKLRNGHLAGNRFTLKVRGVRDAGAATAVLEILTKRGLPNFYGEQRFGIDGRNAEEGKRLLLTGARVPHFRHKLMLSALQSKLFNDVLNQRLERDLFDVVRTGDVLKKHATGGEFVCADPAIDQPRADAFEVSATGPMFGPSMRPAEGEPGLEENLALTGFGLTSEAFERGGRHTQGARRHLRVALAPVDHSVKGDVLRLQFTLPAGSYATVLLGELLKDENRRDL